MVKEIGACYRAATMVCPGPGRSSFGATILEGIQMSDVIERVKKIVVERLEVDAEKVNEKASFIDDPVAIVANHTSNNAPI